MKDYSKLKLLPFGKIKPEGFLKEQLLRNAKGMGGHLDLLEPDMFQKPYFEDFHVPGWPEDLAIGWSAELAATCYAGLIELAYTIDDEELKKRATAWIDKLVATQKEDGYIGTYFNHMDLKYQDFNCYGSSRAYRAMIVYAEATGREDVFEAVHKALLWYVNNWDGDHKTTYSSANIIYPCIYMYKKTGDERLLKFAEDYQDYLVRESRFGNSWKDFADKKIAYYNTHTVNYGDFMGIPAFVYGATGNEEYLNATLTGINKFRKKSTQLTGGPVSVAEYVGPISSSFETEYCCFTVFNRCYINTATVTGMAKFGDYCEEIVYNGAQGARKKDERAIVYMSSPNQIFSTTSSSVQMTDYQVYSPCFVVSCCPTNSVNIIPEFIRSMFMKDNDNNMYAFAYGPITMESDGWKIKEITDYPFRNTVKLEIENTEDKKLFIRIPLWAKGTKAILDGKKISVKKNKDGFAPISLTAGKHTIELTFGVKLEIVKIDDRDASNKRPTAFKYGPLVFSYAINCNWQEYVPEEMAKHERYKGWPCFNVIPVERWGEQYNPEIHRNMIVRRNQFPWNLCVDKRIKAKDIKVELCETTGYPWENAWIKLQVPAYHAPLGSAPYAERTVEPFEKKLAVDKKLTMTLVPHGNTNLRVTYFPYADVKSLKRLEGKYDD